MECRLGSGEEQAVPTRSGASSGSTNALKEGGDGIRAVDLDDSVQIPDVDAQFQSAGCDDDTIGCLTKRGLGLSALFNAQRAVRKIGLNLSLAKQRGDLLHPGAGIAKHQPFLTPMKSGNDQGGILQTADIIDLNFWRGYSLRWCHHRRLFSGAMPGKPFQQLVGIAYRCGKPDPLWLRRGQSTDSFQDEEEMPSPVVASKRMDFINHQRLQ